jgi:hypothetical protein
MISDLLFTSLLTNSAIQCDLSKHARHAEEMLKRIRLKVTSDLIFHTGFDIVE